MDFTTKFEKFANHINGYDPDQALAFHLVACLDLKRAARRALIKAGTSLFAPYATDNGSSLMLGIEAPASAVPALLAKDRKHGFEVMQDAIGQTADVYPYKIKLPASKRYYDHALYYGHTTGMTEKVKAGIKADFNRLGATITDNEKGAEADVAVEVATPSDWKKVHSTLVTPLLMDRVTTGYSRLPAFRF